MSKKAKKWRRLTEQELHSRAYPDDLEAWKQIRKIKEKGHKPSIWCNELNELRVEDEDDLEYIKKRYGGK